MQNLLKGCVAHLTRDINMRPAAMHVCGINIILIGNRLGHSSNWEHWEQTERQNSMSCEVIKNTFAPEKIRLRLVIFMHTIYFKGRE